MSKTEWVITDAEGKALARCDDEAIGKFVVDAFAAAALAEVDVARGDDGVVEVAVRCDEPVRVFVDECVQVYGEPRHVNAEAPPTSGTYAITPRRYSTAVDGSVESTVDNADFFTVVDTRTGARVCRCDTADMADAVFAGLNALDAIEAMKAEREACRMAACFVLGVDTATLEEAIAALCEGFEGKMIDLLGAAPTTEQTGAGQ